MTSSENRPPRKETKTVVIADDDDNIRLILQLLFERDGFHIETASNGQEALDKIESADPDLVILDLMMPVRSGMDVIRELQKGRHQHVPVLAYSGRVLDAPLIEMVRNESNVADFVQKMTSPKGLPERARKILDLPPASR